MSIGDRIAIIIKQNGLKKVEFAAKVNIDQSYVTKIIKGISNASPRLLDDICRKFDVRREWLEQGEGSMFEHRDKTILEQLAAEYKLTPKSRELIENFLSLSQENQKMVIWAFENVARLVQPKVKTPPKPKSVTKKEIESMLQKELNEVAEVQLEP